MIIEVSFILITFEISYDFSRVFAGEATAGEEPQSVIAEYHFRQTAASGFRGPSFEPPQQN